MAIACSTSIRCGSDLETALKTIRELRFKQIDLLTVAPGPTSTRAIWPIITTRPPGWWIGS